MTKDPIEKLREELKVCGCDPDECMVCSVPRKVKAAIAEIEAQYMRLPLDADGVPIRPGDEVSANGYEDGVVASIEITDEGFAYVGVRPHGWYVPTRYTPDGLSHVKPETVEDITCGENLVHVRREDWDDMSEAMDKLRAERDRLAEGLRCMAVERDFWRKRCRSQDETIGGLADKLADEGMA